MVGIGTCISADFLRCLKTLEFESTVFAKKNRAHGINTVGDYVHMCVKKKSSFIFSKQGQEVKDRFVKETKSKAFTKEGKQQILKDKICYYDLGLPLLPQLSSCFPLRRYTNQRKLILIWKSEELASCH